jgi:hypothetical protein
MILQEDQSRTTATLELRPRHIPLVRHKESPFSDDRLFWHEDAESRSVKLFLVRQTAHPPSQRSQIARRLSKHLPAEAFSRSLLELLTAKPSSRIPSLPITSITPHNIQSNNTTTHHITLQIHLLHLIKLIPIRRRQDHIPQRNVHKVVAGDHVAVVRLAVLELYQLTRKGNDQSIRTGYKIERAYHGFALGGVQKR